MKPFQNKLALSWSIKNDEKNVCGVLYRVSGMLSGKYRRDTSLSTLSDSRVAWASMTKNALQAYPRYEQFNNEKTWALIDMLEALGKKYGKNGIFHANSYDMVF